MLVLVVVVCVGWFAVSFTTKGSHAATIEVSLFGNQKVSHAAAIEVFLRGDQNVEQIFSAASATVHRLGYKTTNFTYSLSGDDKSSRSLKAKHEDGIVVEINVDSKKDGSTHLRIRLTEKGEGFSLHDLIDGTALHDVMDATVPLMERVSRILKATVASLESP